MSYLIHFSTYFEMFQFMRIEYQEHLLGQRPTSCRGGERPHGLLDWTEYTGQEVKAVETGNCMVSWVFVLLPTLYIIKYRQKQTTAVCNHWFNIWRDQTYFWQTNEGKKNHENAWMWSNKCENVMWQSMRMNMIQKRGQLSTSCSEKQSKHTNSFL